MSRKWERMVEKNKKIINKQRVKQGRSVISEAGREEMAIFRGRNWVLPLVLISFAVFFMISSNGYYQGDKMFYVTIFSYIALGIFIYMVRRPILRVGKTSISSRRFSGDKRFSADEIEDISITPSSIVFRFKAKRTRWVFAKLMQFEMNALSERVKLFAVQNGVKLIEE